MKVMDRIHVFAARPPEYVAHRASLIDEAEPGSAILLTVDSSAAWRSGLSLNVRRHLNVAGWAWVDTMRWESPRGSTLTAVIVGPGRLHMLEGRNMSHALVHVAPGVANYGIVTAIVTRIRLPVRVGQ